MAERQIPWWYRLEENFAQTRAGGWFAINIANPIDRRLLRWSNGRIATFVGQPVGLLYARGAKSGALRETPLLYCADGDRILLVASNAGSTRHPAWYHNVTANPGVDFLPRGGPRAAYRAREVRGAERDDSWEKVNHLYAGYETYQGRAAGREIPVIALEAEPAAMNAEPTAAETAGLEPR